MSRHQRQLHLRRTSSPIARVLSHNTEYTGAAGIHSEVGLGTTARNHLAERRASNVINTEQEMMRKEMKAFTTNRKALEKSMLSYSQKMREIAARRSQARPSPASDPQYSRPSHKRVEGRHYPKSHTGVLIKPHVGVQLSPTQNDTTRELDLNLQLDNDPLPKLPDIPSVRSRKKAGSRLSVDSGISSDSNLESVRSVDEKYEPKFDTILDQSITNDHSELLKQKLDRQQLHVQEQEKRNHQQHFQHNKVHTPPSQPSPENHQNDSKHSEEICARGRPKERIRFRDSKTFKLAPQNTGKDDVTSEDKEYDGDEEDEDDKIVTPRIVPFPYDILPDYWDISPLILSSILENEEFTDSVSDSLFTKQSPRGGYGFTKSRTKTKYVLFRPKPSHSPSLAALKFRLFRRFRANSIYFKYSDEILAALRNLGSSPDRHTNGQANQSLSPVSKFSSRSSSPSKRASYSPSLSPSSSCSSPTLHNINLEELLMHLAKRRGGLDRLLQELEEAEEGNEFFLTKDTPKLPTPQPLVRERSSARSVHSTTSVSYKNQVTTHLEQVNEADETELISALKKDADENIDDKRNVQFDLVDSFTRDLLNYSE